MCALLNKGQTSLKPPCFPEDAVDSVIPEYLLMSPSVCGAGLAATGTPATRHPKACPPAAALHPGGGNTAQVILRGSEGERRIKKDKGR